MQPKTEELLYLLLWSCEMLIRPTFRNLTGSFEEWAYRHGLHREVAELERRKLLESSSPRRNERSAPAERLLRLTMEGRLHALGGRDPAASWERPWDGRWRLVLFDLPMRQAAARNRLRDFLRQSGFGCLQGSVWVSPHPLPDQQAVLSRSRVDVRTLILFEAHPCAGENDNEIVEGAWNFAQINRSYARHLEVLDALPRVALGTSKQALLFRKWAAQERATWLDAVAGDPLLPGSLLPDHYLGRKAWQTRLDVMRQAAEQIRSFQT